MLIKKKTEGYSYNHVIHRLLSGRHNGTVSGVHALLFKSFEKVKTLNPLRFPALTVIRQVCSQAFTCWSSTPFVTTPRFLQ